MINEQESSLTHHGIYGQKWGKRNGPPYPLDAADHSEKEKRLNKGKYSRDANGNPVKSNNDGSENHGGHSSGGGGSSQQSQKQDTEKREQNTQNKPQQSNTNRNNQGNSSSNNDSNNQTSSNQNQNEQKPNNGMVSKESREYQRNLNKQKRLNNKQYKQLSKYQNQINKQQRDIYRQQKSIANQKAEVYRKELTNAQKERELKEIRKEQSKIRRQQNAQQRMIRRENERRLDEQLANYRNQLAGNGNNKGNNNNYMPVQQMMAPAYPGGFGGVPGMTLEDYKRYKAKRKAVKIAKGTAKTVGKAAAIVGVTSAVAAAASLTIGGYISGKTLSRVAGALADNPRTIRRAIANVGDSVKSLGSGGATIGKSIFEAFTERSNQKRARKTALSILDTLEDTIIKSLDSKTLRNIDIDLDRKTSKKIAKMLAGNGVSEISIGADDIANAFRKINRKTKKLEGIELNLTNKKAKETIGEGFKKAASDILADRRVRKEKMAKAKLDDARIRKIPENELKEQLKKIKRVVAYSDSGELKTKEIQEWPPLVKALIKNPRKLNDNPRVRDYILDMYGSKGLNEIISEAKSYENFAKFGKTHKADWYESTGWRGIINNSSAFASGIKNRVSTVKSTFDNSKKAAGIVSAMTVGAYLNKRSKRKEEQMRNRIEEEMLDEYFFGRH